MTELRAQVREVLIFTLRGAKHADDMLAMPGIADHLEVGLERGWNAQRVVDSILRR